ncbi:MAG: hypothetical protein H0Z28_13875 [Archaeoglobus sp.]|nr:hypothetical protein [Archaeoglobus sp.]
MREDVEVGKKSWFVVGFTIGFLLAIGVNPTGIVIEVLEKVLENFYIVFGVGATLIGLIVLLKILNKAEPAITAFEAYSEGGGLGFVTFFLGLLAGFTIIKVPPIGVFLIVVAMILER